MADRLTEIKNRIAATKTSPDHYEATRYGPVKGLQDLIWSVAEIESLQEDVQDLEQWLEDEGCDVRRTS